MEEGGCARLKSAGYGRTLEEESFCRAERSPKLTWKSHCRVLMHSKTSGPETQATVPTTACQPMPCLFCLVPRSCPGVRGPLGTWVSHGVPWCALLRPTLATQRLQGPHSRSGLCFLDLPPLLNFLNFSLFPFPFEHFPIQSYNFYFSHSINTQIYSHTPSWRICATLVTVTPTLQALLPEFLSRLKFHPCAPNCLALPCRALTFILLQRDPLLLPTYLLRTSIHIQRTFYFYRREPNR